MFPLLSTTHLTACEIVLGKWLSRCVQVGMVLLAGLPVLTMAQVCGGIVMVTIERDCRYTFTVLNSLSG